MARMPGMTINVHTDRATQIAHKAFPDCPAGPFVTVEVGPSGHQASLLVSDPAVLTELISVATTARADLVSALTEKAAAAA